MEVNNARQSICNHLIHEQFAVCVFHASQINKDRSCSFEDVKAQPRHRNQIGENFIIKGGRACEQFVIIHIDRCLPDIRGIQDSFHTLFPIPTGFFIVKIDWMVPVHQQIICIFGEVNQVTGEIQVESQFLCMPDNFQIVTLPGIGNMQIACVRGSLRQGSNVIIFRAVHVT